MPAIAHLRRGGFIIVDNSDRDAEVGRLLLEKDFFEIDFSGFGPINAYTWTTSIFLPPGGTDMRIVRRPRPLAAMQTGRECLMARSTVRIFANKCRESLARILIRGALRLSVPGGLMDLNGRTVAPILRDHLTIFGADRIFDDLYALARGDDSLRDHMIQDAADRMFHGLYAPALKSAAPRRYMIERGIGDLYDRIEEMAKDVGAPLADRVVGYGQEGEDLILGRLFGGKATGFYVDVGAHHPFRYSNTYLLYQRGWRGVNIDAMPGSMTAFRNWRPRDINVESMVSSTPDSHTYFQYDEPALNTVSEAVVRKRDVESPQYRVIGTVTLQSRTLADLLAEHVPPDTVIDLMNVDVEGLDLDVLASNDWDRFRPRLIVVELLWTGFSDMENSQMYRFLIARGYRLLSKLMNSAIFSL